MHGLNAEWNNGGYYSDNNNCNYANGYTPNSINSYTQIQVSQGQHYIIRGNSSKTFALAVLYDESGNIIHTYKASTSNPVIYQAEVDVDNPGILIVNSYKFADIGYPAIYLSTSYKPKDTKFDGKTVLFSGDSITNGYGWDSGVSVTNRKIICLTNPKGKNYYNLGWAQTFAEDHRSATVYGYGVNGTRISQTAGSNSITERISSMSETADYVIFSGGINDCFKKVPLGEMVSTNAGNNAWKSASFDTSTYCGALETLFRNAYKKWPNAKIGFIITGKNTTA